MLLPIRKSDEVTEIIKNLLLVIYFTLNFELVFYNYSNLETKFIVISCPIETVLTIK